MCIRQQRFKSQGRHKGQAETPFVLTMIFFLVFMVWLTTQIQPRFPQFQGVSQIDFTIFIAGILGVAGACAIATGLPCAAALIVFNTIQFFAVQNTLIGTFIILPMSCVLAYVVARLGAHGG